MDLGEVSRLTLVWRDNTRPHRLSKPFFLTIPASHYQRENRWRRPLAGNLTVSLFAILCACSTPVDPIDGSSSSPTDLLGPVWELVSFQPSRGVIEKLPSGQDYYVLFKSDGTFSGRADCNSIFGKYRAEQEGIISVGSIGTTYVLCPEESHLDEYLDALRRSTGYEQSGDHLRLSFGKRGVLRYIKRRPLSE
jgi:heat shock protein HslJ